MRKPVPESLILYKKYPFAELYYAPELQLAMLVSAANFLPIEEFKAVFIQVAEGVMENKLRKVLFDKRSLTVFHQPSMEWYYLEWKVSLLNEEGVMEHAKILPKDDLLRKSVEEAKRKIFKDNPTSPIQRLNLRYYENFPEALEKF